MRCFDTRRPATPALRSAWLGLVLVALAGTVVGQTPNAGPDGPAPGDVLTPFDAQALDGTTKHVTFPKDGSTVLLFFSSGCPVCHRMIPEWNRAYLARPKNLTVIGVLVDQEPPGFFSTMPISFPVVRSPGQAFMAALKVRHVPLTVRVAPRGIVDGAGTGILDAIRLGELFRP